jgi:hypothetical protein
MKRLVGIAALFALVGCAEKPAAICSAESTLSTVSEIVAPAAQGTGAQATPRADVVARISYSLIVVDEHDPKTGRVKCSATLGIDTTGLKNGASPPTEGPRVEYTVQPDAQGKGAVVTVAPGLARLVLIELASSLDEQRVATAVAAAPAPAPAPAPEPAAEPVAPTAAVVTHRDFADFPAQPFTGTSQAPDFSGRESEYADFRTRLTKSFNEGVNFGGAYSIVEIGCGTGCRFVYIINHKNGAISSFPLGGEENPYLGLNYVPNSTLVQATWEGGEYDARVCFQEDFNWTTREFQSLGRSQSPGTCP